MPDDQSALRVRVRERLKDIIWEYADAYTEELLDKAVDAILREFALRPVSQGVVKDQEVEWTKKA